MPYGTNILIRKEGGEWVRKDKMAAPAPMTPSNDVFELNPKKMATQSGHRGPKLKELKRKKARWGGSLLKEFFRL